MSPAADSLPATLAALLSERIARRDDPVVPDQTATAVAARFDEWLRTTHHLRDPRRRRCLTQMLLLLLAQPEAGTEALHAAGGVGPRSGARAMRQLADWGLTTHTYREGRRYHRLTRAGEDALLPVVTGARG